MSQRLAHRKQCVEDVEELMNWSLLPRDAEGFTDVGKPLRFPHGEKLCSKLLGTSINIRTGVVHFDLEYADNNGSNALFTASEVDFVMRNGLSECAFSLDPENLSLVPQPFQEMWYAPACIKDTDFLKTLLMCDYLLKSLLNGVDVSAKAPFRKRPISKLLSKVPEYIRDALMSPAMRRNLCMCGNSAIEPAATRCWIQCEEVECLESNTEDTYNILFVDVNVEIKHQLFRLATNADKAASTSSTHDDYLIRQNLVEFKGNGESGEEKFATDMTLIYDDLSDFFPLLKRLQELAKLCAMSRFMSSTAKRLRESASSNTLAVKALAQIQAKYPYSIDNEVCGHTLVSVGTWRKSASSTKNHDQSSCHLVPSTLVLHYTKTQAVTTGQKFNVGDLVDVEDIFCFWFTAEVKVITNTRVLIRYDGWGDEWDEWISVDSIRLQPIHTHTPSGQRSCGRGSGILRLRPVGTQVMALCSDKVFRESKIIEVNTQTAALLVKFEDERYLSNWIPAFQFRLPDDLEPASADDVAKQNFHVGQDVDVVDLVFRCYTGTILQLTDAGNVKVHFDGWPSTFDEWITAKMVANRIYPLHKYTMSKLRTIRCAQGIPDGSVPVSPSTGQKVIVIANGSRHLATVEQATNCGQQVFVRFENMSLKSEWVSTKDGCMCLPEIVMNPASPADIATGNLCIGDDIDARDHSFTWYTVTVIEVDSKVGRIRIRWHGWPSSYDEWIRTQTPRIAPLFTYTPAGFKSQNATIGRAIAPSVGTHVVLKSSDADNTWTMTHGEVVERHDDTKISVRCNIDGSLRKVDVTAYGTVIDDTPLELAFCNLSSYTYGGVILPGKTRVLKENQFLLSPRQQREDIKVNTNPKSGSSSSIETSCTTSGKFKKRGYQSLLKNQNVELCSTFGGMRVLSKYMANRLCENR
jgi:hypothetical protein